MVQHLANHGANSIWEHSLLDPSQSKHGKKKPGPRDQVQYVYLYEMILQHACTTIMVKQGCEY
jgi:hypothetical protein